MDKQELIKALDSILDECSVTQTAKATLRESLYFEEEVVEDKKDQIESEYKKIITSYYTKEFISNKPGDDIRIDGKYIYKLDATDEENIDYSISFADSLLDNVFGSNDSAKLRSKAIFLVYTSGLDSNQTNLFGIYRCLVAAMSRIGVSTESHLRHVSRELTNLFKETMIIPEVVGSIAKCSFLGMSLNIDKNDKFANASGSDYLARVNAVIRDNYKKNNIDYNIKTKMFEKIYKEQYNKFNDMLKVNPNKKEDIISNLKKRNPDATEEDLNNVYLPRFIRDYAKKQATNLYNKWTTDGSFQKVMDDYNYVKNLPPEDTSNDFSFV